MKKIIIGFAFLFFATSVFAGDSPIASFSMRSVRDAEIVGKRRGREYKFIPALSWGEDLSGLLKKEVKQRLGEPCRVKQQTDGTELWEYECESIVFCAGFAIEHYGTLKITSISSAQGAALAGDPNN